MLSAKALEAIYHTASSSVGKLISGKQYLGGYAMEQQRGKAEVEGKELPYKRRKKLQTKDTAIPSNKWIEKNNRVFRRFAKFAETKEKRTVGVRFGE